MGNRSVIMVNMTLQCAWLLFMLLSSLSLDSANAKVDVDLPPNVDQKTYCELCKTAASVLYKNVKEKKMTLYEAWDKLCVSQTFSSLHQKLNKKKYEKDSPSVSRLSELVTGCQYLLQPAKEDSVHPMYEMVRQLGEHDGSEVEYKSAMCHMNSDACRGVNKKISDVDGPVDVSAEEIQRILNADSVRRPDPVRPKHEDL